MPKQEYDSKKTSIAQISAPYTNKRYAPLFHAGDRVLDYGGGRYDLAKNYMATKDVMVDIYDPYWRTAEHNKSVLAKFRKKAPDVIVCANVLNVIKEDSIVADVVKNIRHLAGKNTIVIFSVFERDKTGIGTKTTMGWQRNDKSADYGRFILPYFPDAIRQGNFWIVR